MIDELSYEILEKIVINLNFKDKSKVLQVNKSIYYKFPSIYNVEKCKKIINEKINSKYEIILRDYNITVSYYKCIGCNYTTSDEIDDSDFNNKGICNGEISNERKGCHCKLPIFTIKFNKIDICEVIPKIQLFEPELNELYNLLFNKWLLEKLKLVPIVKYNSPWFYCIYVSKDDNNNLFFDMPEKYFNKKYNEKTCLFLESPYI